MRTPAKLFPTQLWKKFVSSAIARSFANTFAAPCMLLVTEFCIGLNTSWQCCWRALEGYHKKKIVTAEDRAFILVTWHMQEAGSVPDRGLVLHPEFIHIHMSLIANYTRSHREKSNNFFELHLTTEFDDSFESRQMSFSWTSLTVRSGGQEVISLNTHSCLLAAQKVCVSSTRR